MDASGHEPGGLTTGIRVLLVAFAVLSGLGFSQLYLLSGQTGRYFAWTIVPDISAAFLGAGYGAGCVLVLLSLRSRMWVEVRVGVLVILVFTAMVLVSTLLHLGRFHFGPESGFIARFAAWLFLAVYVLTPPVGTWLFLRQQRLAGPAPSGGLALPGWLKVTLAVQSGLMATFGLALYVAPAALAPAWPWTLTTLTAQAVAAWLVPIALAGLAILREGDLRRARVPAVTYVLFGLLQLGAVLRYLDQVQWDEPGAWIWLALLASMIAVGAYGLLATSPRRSALPAT